ncbi:unnamed protein product [Heterobilharzia americana]|nr:unnamed protein product [Heterobilharzia americana]
MLTTALNFLSDKRKRFHRSDTMPIFTNDSNLFKLNSDNQLVENQKQCNKNKDYDDEDIVSVNVCKKSDVNCQDETLLSKSVCYQGGLSSSSKSCALRQLSSNDDNDDDDYDTEFVKLPSFSSTEKNCPEGMKMHSNEKHLSVGNLNKYQFLNLETNLYRHQKNLSNSPPHGNTSQGCLSHGYSLSSMQVPLNPTGSENNVFTSFTVWKKDSSDLRHIPKDGKTNSSAACKVVDGSKSVRLPSKLSESHALVSDDLNSELTLDHSTKATSSGKSKVVRMRARAVARAAKGKLKRSKSSAYMSRQFRDLPSEDNNVRGRSSSAHRDPDISVQENKPVQTSSENKPRPGLVRSWIDKNPRLRLDTSPQRSSNASNIGEVANADEVIEQLVNKANAYKFQVINALEHFKPLTEVSVSGNAINSDLVTAMQNNNYSPKILSSRSLMTSANNSAKPNRYSVVKKLRRNNSSIACSNDQLPTSHEEQSMISTSSTAGDLLLPSKNYKTSDIASEDEDDFIKNITGNLFTVVRNDDCEQFLKLFDHYQRLKDKSFGQIQKSTNEFGLSALDSAHLTASLPLISCLMVCGFSPGPNGSIFTSLLEEKEIQLTKCKVETKNAIARANHLTITESSKDSCSLIQPNQQQEQIINTTAFAEVAMKEKELQTVLDEYEYLSKLIENYSRFPKSTKPPNKVNIYLNSSNSILIRISPPKNGRFIKANFHQNSADTSDVDTCYKNNRVECDLDQDQSSCESTDNDLIHDPINEGRKINGVHQIHSNNFILYYCIEWSTCPKFSNSEVYNSLVQPPIRVIKPYSHSMKHKQFSILRVGFYCLNNLPENKMVFVRVFAFSIKGWSEPCYANPNGIVLSSWIDNKICELYRNTVQRENLSLSYTKYVGCTLDEELDTFKNNLSKQLFSWTRSYPMNSNTSSGSSNSTITGVPVNTVEETSKRTKSPMLQRKRSFRFPFSNKGLKFVKQTKSGVYLAVLYHTPTTSSNITMDDESGKFKYKSKIVLADDYIPILSVSREDYTNESTLNSDFNWFARIVSDSFFDMDLQFLYEDMPNTSLPTNLQLRVRLLEMLQRLKLLLGTSNLGTIYPEIIRVRSIDSSLINLKQTKNENSDIQEILSTPKVSTETNDSIATSTSYESNPKSTSSFLFVLVKRINNPNEIILTGNLRWCHLDKFLRQNKVKLNNFFPIHSNVEFSNYSIMTNMTRNILLPALYPHLLTTRGNQVFISPESQLIANLDILLGYSERHMHILEPGLYIVLVQMKAHMDQQAAILVSNTPTTIHMLPAEKIRSRSHVSKDEWYSLCRLVERTDEKNEENFINLKIQKNDLSFS